MLTLLLALWVGILCWLFGYYIVYPSYILASILFIVGVITFNFFMSRYFMKKLTAIFNSCEKDLKSGRTDIAIEKMKTGYKYSPWQFMVKKQIDSQIGIILYASKKFEEAVPYLKQSLKSNWMAMSMLAAYYYRTHDYKSMENIVDKSVKANKKDSFTQNLGAYLYSEIGKHDKSIEILVKASKKMPTDEKIENSLDALRNKRKIKIQSYGALWMQLHLGKSPDGVKQYQTLIGRQKITRR